jgi:hypothetical protein
MSASMTTNDQTPAPDPQAQADAWMKDDSLARAKGDTPEQVEARTRVAQLFCQIHLPDDTPDARAARLAAIDYACPVSSTNARGIDVNNTRGTGFLGFGRKKSYILSAKYPPQKDEDPIYALEFTPVKR